MLILTDVQKVKVKVKPVTAAGNPAPVDGKPEWVVSDDTVCTLVVSDDGLEADVVTTGKLGVCQVSVKADADLGDGVREISGVLDVEVKASEAVSLSVETGVPEPKV